MVLVLEAIIVGRLAFSVGYYVTIRERMKARDEEIEARREMEREEEARLSLNRKPKTDLFNHFSHKHPLVEFNSPTKPCGNCRACNQPITRGWAYRCSHCTNYYLHEVCAKDLVSLTPCSYSRAKEIRVIDEPTIISTFAHEEHRVKHVYSNQDFACQHCYTLGCGKRFRCNDCDMNFHPICATCPTKISSFMHPQHDLELKTRRHFSVCAICNKKTKSNIRMYRCKECGFFVHPSCSQLPQHLMHDFHPPCPLKLRLAEESRLCDAKCKSKCEKGQWCYECEECGVSIHINCILQHCVRGTTNKKEPEEILQMLDCVKTILETSGHVIDIVSTSS